MFSVFDSLGAWTQAVNAPVTTTCMSSAACIPPAFGAEAGPMGFNSQGLAGDDGDWFKFTLDPAVKAIGFNGFAIAGRPFGLAIMGMGRLGGAPLYLYSSTGFIGVIASHNTERWKPGMIIVAPHCADIITQMHFVL